MNTSEKKQNRIIGVLLLTGAIALLIPYNILIVTFDYPDILRQHTSLILQRFHAGGNALIWTWFAFAITGLPLIPAYLLIGRLPALQNSFVKVATTIGFTGLIVQMIGLLRWTFVVPVLADTYVNAVDDATRASVIVAFKMIHQFAGVLLGEHIGQLFTVVWTIMITVSLQRINAIPRWVNYLAYLASAIYFLAQAELLATVIPSFPVWGMAGFAGSTLWLIWIIILGVYFLRNRIKLQM